MRFAAFALTCLLSTAAYADNAWMDNIDKTNVILGRDGQGFCSGTFIGQGKDRLVLTAAHCVNDAFSVTTKQVTDPKTHEVHDVKIEETAPLEIWANHYKNFEVVSAAHYEVKILSRDETGDVALLQVVDDNFMPSLTAKFAAPGEPLKRGQPVFIVGNPGIEFDASVTEGIVSNTQRTLDFGHGKGHFFQTDAAAIGGNSGGSVYNDKGEMIGTLTGGLKGTTMTFVVPIQVSRDMLKRAGFSE